MTKGGEHRTDGPAEQSGKHDACELWTSKPGEFGPEEASGPAVSGKPARIIRTAYFTDRGRALAERLFALWPGARPEYREKGEPLGEWTGRSFAKKRPVLFIGACGIAVRAIAPFVRDKLSDSPVLVMDEQGRHVIPILSGHIGGANALALEIARLVGADPVITTATDVNHLFAVDVFAKMNGLRITDRDGIRRVSARLLQNGRLHVFVEGDASLRNGMPAELIPCRREEADLVVLTSDGAPDGPEGWADTPLVLVPKTWCLGMGCRRGKTAAELMTFLEARVAPRDVLRDRVFAIASIDRKADEQGLIDLAALLGVPFLTFSAETLKEMQGDFAGSAFVSRTVGVDNVCERAAAAAADGGELIIRKTAGDGITAAVARRTVRSLRWTDYRN
ncbi:MAG: cobalamin biosynthesis protein [Eubacteriales bacterium]|jgi:cobalt-precorrin 5A hydrolase|nr:cobalamin biosynthesis protein [Lachnospiraceae bacterium]MDD5860300.1 cobalamin biosynthesis protein [Eubacteriales bacterium]MCH4063921.1 cobalamin biosynthesis protein [Lachnospiraceae bacterium]MCH4103357.1 cobalamin biosynthesis protein [Lachnospiraceae bacterium]MCI1309306.1 cobalamin biosynthesis protein [Lachnospiraceae bacterium]